MMPKRNLSRNDVTKKHGPRVGPQGDMAPDSKVHGANMGPT